MKVKHIITNKSKTKSLRLSSETYGGVVLAVLYRRRLGQRWRRPRWGGLLNVQSCQSGEKLAGSLGLAQRAISKCHNAIIQKQSDVL